MNENKVFYAPYPMINKKEADSLDVLTERYNKLIKPNKITQLGTKVGQLVPEKVKILGNDIKSNISEQELYRQTMELISSGFKVVEEQAARFSVSEKMILKKVNKVIPDYEITELSEICFARSYSLSKLVNAYKAQDIVAAFVEGGATGVAGFWGLPFNLGLSTFLYFRAVQSIAMFYGYDVKNDSVELVIASEVFASALSPVRSETNNEVTDIIVKVMVMTQASLVKQTAKKTWTDMATRGSIPLLLAQMRALANKAAEKALEKAGAKGLENSLFREVFEQIGRKLTLKTVQKAVPVVSAIFGALIDTAQMQKVLDYADTFYQKRYILEKESRVNALLERDNVVVDALTVDDIIDADNMDEE
ncbi:EcsC family protein [Clostridium sp.]|uniref:EcsC family protein n=1 Tax=Clostridium sp. TaxID=1506 RepID=UPI00321663B5